MAGLHSAVPSLSVNSGCCRSVTPGAPGPWWPCCPCARGWGTGSDRGITLSWAGFHCCFWEGSEFTVGEPRPALSQGEGTCHTLPISRMAVGINSSKPLGITPAVGSYGASTVGLICTPGPPGQRPQGLSQLIPAKGRAAGAGGNRSSLIP